MSTAPNTPNATTTYIAPPTKNNPKRRKSLIILGTVVVIGGIAFGLYEWLVSSHYETTDNAYVQGNIIQITPQISGTVQAIMVDDTDFVKAGQVLVKLDAADANIALAQAEANLADTVRQVRTLYANNGSLKSQTVLRQAEITRAQSDLAQAQDDLNRRLPLAHNGAVSHEEIDHAKSKVATAQSALAVAKAALETARESLSSNQSLTEGVPVAEHPSVLLAAAKLREAHLANQRTELLAPVDGVVAKRSAQLGQRIAAGTTMLTVIPLQQIWVEANLKENQLRKLHIGQPATLTADLYGDKVTYHGKVVGMGAGTGAAFSLLPAQNATGNWIKVVQRVPVRIALDPEELAKKPLRIGLSMFATIDVRNQDGAVLATVPRANAEVHTTVTDQSDQLATEEIARIIAENAGSNPAQTKPVVSTAKATVNAQAQ